MFQSQSTRCSVVLPITIICIYKIIDISVYLNIFSLHTSLSSVDFYFFVIIDCLKCVLFCTLNIYCHSFYFVSFICFSASTPSPPPPLLLTIISNKLVLLCNIGNTGQTLLVESSDFWILDICLIDLIKY